MNRMAGKKKQVRGARGPYAVGLARREQIITEAARLFAERGFEGVTTQAVADACGISRAGVLHHFPDKDSLLANVLQVTLGGPQDMQRAQAYTQTPDGLELLRSVAELSERTQSGADVPQLVIRLAVEAADPSHPAHSFFVARYREIDENLTYVLRLVESAEYLRPGVVVEQAAIRLAALVDGLQIQWLLDRDLDIVDQVRQAIADMLTEEGQVAFADAFALSR
ncbi:MAG: TetR/AcrR family transcriptional regulator [Propionibacteriaceae bacterium]|nr:TetR/AcrR family transcriptional regulator [Propionibacteriaceae bacterium]